MIVQKIVAGMCTALLASTLSVAALAGAGPAPVQPDHPDHSHTPGPNIAIGPISVGGNVSVVMGLNGFAGGNVGVSAGPDGLLIVDDLLPGFEHKLEDVLSTMKTCAECGELKYLINTHWHFDHVGNNEHFGGAPVVIAHETVRPLLAEPQEFKMFAMHFPAKSRAGLPDVTFTQKASVFFNGEEIELTHFPKSHTSGDIVAYFKDSKVLHLGDLYFNGMFPVIDLEHGGSVQGMIASIEAVLEQYPADTKVIPGHGPVSDMKEVKAYLGMLKSTTKAVATAKQAGLSLDDVKKQGLDMQWASWSWSFVSTETWITFVYNSL
ncbi:MBL fold metallo-hydrolase [Magnetovibrio sp.]|uniref:MBL fold metallo-hydrolase n=1 Tax=Magnetovibrio sp. TaxID=2024836 RepID=UPI002F92B30D